MCLAAIFAPVLRSHSHPPVLTGNWRSFILGLAVAGFLQAALRTATCLCTMALALSRPSGITLSIIGRIMVLMAACMRVVPDRPRDFRICATGHKGAMADIRHKTSSKGRLPNWHATALLTGERITIRRKVECRRSTTSPWAPWQRQDRAADCAQGAIFGANISDQRPSLSLGRSTKGHLREDRYQTI